MSSRGLHPSKDITGTQGTELSGKTIVLCISGSVAAYRAIDLARLLSRHGGDVRAVMTPSSEMMVTAEMMRWATGNEVVTALTGNLEHVALADFGRSDLIIVYPCTANTLGKAAHGIDDTPVTSILSVGLGTSTPIIIAPAMHEAMFDNQIISENIKKLAKMGVVIVSPSIEEGKAKVAAPEQILKAAIAQLGPKTLAGKKILVTAGSTVEHIDPIRVITNQSSGKMGIALANQASAMGASVTLVFGIGTEIPHADKIIRVKTSAEMHSAVVSELSSSGYDIVIMAAAVADFSPQMSKQKIDTRKGSLTLKLSPTIKIVNQIKKYSPDSVLVAFKAEWGLEKSSLVEKARQKLRECRGDFVIANDLSTPGAEPGSDSTEVYILGKDNFITHVPLASKNYVARKIMETLSTYLQDHQSKPSK